MVRLFTNKNSYFFFLQKIIKKLFFFKIISAKASITLSEIYFNNSPVTNIRWRPFDENSEIKNILLSTHVNGEILHWHAGSSII